MKKSKQTTTTAPPCKSHCFKYRTEKGYLCDKMESTLGGMYKPWCRIGKNQVEQITANGLRLPPERMPKKTLTSTNEYWDYIAITGEENAGTHYCFTDLENIDSRKVCSNRNKIDYVQDLKKIYWWKFASFFLCRPALFIVKTTVFTSPITVPHFYEKYNEAGFSDRDIMIHLVDDYQNFLEEIALKVVDPNPAISLLSQSDIEYITTSLREEIHRAFPDSSLPQKKHGREIYQGPTRECQRTCVQI